MERANPPGLRNVFPGPNATKLLIILALIHFVNPSPWFLLELPQSEREDRSIGRRKSRHGAGSRTRVTVLAVFGCYRFSPTPPPECPHETVVPQCRPLDPQPQTSLRGNLGRGLFDRRAGGYAGAAAENSSGRMLLPLRGDEFKYRVREDVRFEKARAALVGEVLHQTSHANASE
jgi:hypothetical protein